jgi:HlyD family secretion protein
LKRVYGLVKLFVGVVVLSGLIVVLWPVKKVPVSTVRLEKGDVEEVVTPLYNAVVQANKFAHIRGSTPGEVADILVKKGDRVPEGALVIQLKNNEQLARLRLAEANLAAGMAQLQQARIKSSSSQKNLERVTQLRDSGIIPEANFDQAKTESDVVKKAVAITEADIAQLKASVEIARSLYDATFVRAPFDGKIADIFVEKGESVVPGAPLYDIYDDSALYVVARFDEIDVSRLSHVDEARISFDTMRGADFKAKIEWISSVVSVDMKSGRGVDVKLSFEEKDPSIRIGMSAEVEVVVNVKRDTRYLPTSVIMGKGAERFVYCVEKGRAKKRPVQVGLSNWDRTEVLGGVDENDEVISSVNLSELKEGVRVVLQEKQT